MAVHAVRGRPTSSHPPAHLRRRSSLSVCGTLLSPPSTWLLCVNTPLSSPLDLYNYTPAPPRNCSPQGQIAKSSGRRAIPTCTWSAVGLTRPAATSSGWSSSGFQAVPSWSLPSPAAPAQSPLLSFPLDLLTSQSRGARSLCLHSALAASNLRPQLRQLLPLNRAPCSSASFGDKQGPPGGRTAE